MRLWHDRRRFLESASLVGAAGLFGLPKSTAAEAPPEVKTIRLRKTAAICFAPLYVLEEFLASEGFTNVEYLTGVAGTSGDLIEDGTLDFDVNFAGSVVQLMDKGARFSVLGGLHVGCYELFAHEPIRKVSELKGKRVWISQPNSANHVLLSIMAAYVGLDPNEDIDWLTRADGEAIDLFAAREVDAFLGFPPEPQEFRDRGFERVIVNTIIDLPWSQYFCCVVYGSRAKIRDHPIATKRFLRAMYKAADFCTAEPEAAARRLVDGGFAKRYDYSLETINQVRYREWRDYDPEDSLRFYALRLHEVGMISSTPNKIIYEGTNWRFFDELKREMKV